MRTVVGAVGRGSAMVSGATLARPGSSGGRVVTEAIGLSKTPSKNRSNRDYSMREEDRNREAGDQGLHCGTRTLEKPLGLCSRAARFFLHPGPRTRDDVDEIAFGGPSQHGLSFRGIGDQKDRKSTRLNSSHLGISYAVFCLKKM